MTPICSLAELATVLAEMAFGRDAAGQRLSYHQALAAHGFTHERWRLCESYWTPRIGAPTFLGEPNHQYDAALSEQFYALMLRERDRLLGAAATTN